MESRLKIRCSNTSYDQIDLSYRLQVLKINWAMCRAKFSIWRGIGRGIYTSKFATFASKLCEPVANSSEQIANQNTNIAAEVCKVAWKRTSGLTVSIWAKIYLFSTITKKTRPKITKNLCFPRVEFTASTLCFRTMCTATTGDGNDVNMVTWLKVEVVLLYSLQCCVILVVYLMIQW